MFKIEKANECVLIFRICNNSTKQIAKINYSLNKSLNKLIEKIKIVNNNINIIKNNKVNVYDMHMKKFIYENESNEIINKSLSLMPNCNSLTYDIISNRSNISVETLEYLTSKLILITYNDNNCLAKESIRFYKKKYIFNLVNNTQINLKDYVIYENILISSYILNNLQYIKIYEIKEDSFKCVNTKTYSGVMRRIKYPYIYMFYDITHPSSSRWKTY